MAQRITGHTELIGLLANPIRNSKSPMMHNTAFEALGLDFAYLVFEVDQTTLKDAIQGMKALKVKGFNVSMPNKTAVMQYLDEILPAGQLCGAVNTVLNQDGRLIGTNTDGLGFMLACEAQGMHIKGKKITVLGAGGAATAVCMQAGLDGVSEISIFQGADAFWDKALQNAEKLNTQTSCKAKVFHLEDTEALRREINDSVMLVNATGCGFCQPIGPCLIPDKSYLRPDLMVFDVIYSPAETQLLAWAKEVGCTCSNGLEMMFHQGAAAFKWWMGKEMPLDIVRKVFKELYG
ncbi:MAG: shikimate dehydrogenase [Bacteroidales bacterium]|nr:shikimate dehydrogenase [Bacteroidales bacterium]